MRNEHFGTYCKISAYDDPRPQLFLPNISMSVPISSHSVKYAEDLVQEELDVEAISVNPVQQYYNSDKTE